MLKIDERIDNAILDVGGGSYPLSEFMKVLAAWSLYNAIADLVLAESTDEDDISVVRERVFLSINRKTTIWQQFSSAVLHKVVHKLKEDAESVEEEVEKLTKDFCVQTYENLNPYNSRCLLEEKLKKIINCNNEIWGRLHESEAYYFLSADWKISCETEEEEDYNRW